jgi:hypothetical protein
LQRTAACLESARGKEAENFDSFKLGAALDDIRDVLKAAEICSVGINPATLMPAQETFTFRVWHDEDATRGLALERAKVELEIGAVAASQRIAYIEEVRTSLRNLFSTLWDIPATVLTEEELAEAAGEVEAPQP